MTNTMKHNESHSKNNIISIVKTLIQSLKNVTSREELNHLANMARDYIANFLADNPQLLSQLEAVTTIVEGKITKDEQVASHKAKAAQEHNEEALPKMPLNAHHNEGFKVNLASLAIVRDLAIKSAFGEKSDNLYDGAFGETIKVLEAQEAKDMQREESKSRVDSLRNLGSMIADSKELSPEIQEEVIKQAANFHINLKREENNVLVADEKSLKVLDKVAKLDMKIVEEKRATRKADDKVDHLDVALEGGSLGSLFGDDDFAVEPVKKPIASQSSVVDKMKERHPPITEDSRTPPKKTKESFVEQVAKKPEEKKYDGWERKLDK